jgi:signal transduction protein with GAF and PtsI domain
MHAVLLAVNCQACLPVETKVFKMNISMPQNNTDGNLLFTLEEISQLVSHSHNAAETLDNIVRLIQHRFQVAVCSFYLYQHETKELILAATLGLRPEMRGRLRMSVDEGLTGLVAQGLAPVMVPEAPRHPRFKYFPDFLHVEVSSDIISSAPLLANGNLFMSDDFVIYLY